MNPIRIIATVLGLCTPTLALAVDGDPLPRSATPAELLLESLNPATRFLPRGPTASPQGSVICPGEYAPMDGIVLSYHPNYSPSILSIVRQMAAQITTTGRAKAYVVFDPAPSAATLSLFQTAGADMTKIIPITRTLDSIWMRDYGPRYIYEGGDAAGNGACRAIIDHTYNRSLRMLDNTFPISFAGNRRHALYTIPLVHGGGNHHLDSLGRAYATRLIANENPQLGATSAAREAAVVALWHQYQNITTTITDPFPTNIDVTQHIDMWAQVIGDDKIMVSQWPTALPGAPLYEPFRITEAFAASSAAPAGPYTVYRVPARSIGGVHYTYTNVVMCNDLVLVPSYTNATMVPLNAEAVAAYQAALPGKTVVPINCQSLVTLAGVMHCIVMHMPRHMGNDNGSGNLAPTAYLRSPNGGETFTPDQTINACWISDDDTLVSNVDLELSFDSGTTWPLSIALMTADDGQQSFVLPNYFSRHARLRVTARDSGSPARTGADISDADFSLDGTCRADVNNSLTLTAQDIFDFLAAYFASAVTSDFNDSGAISVQDIFDFLDAYFAGC